MFTRTASFALSGSAANRALYGFRGVPALISSRGIHITAKTLNEQRPDGSNDKKKYEFIEKQKLKGYTEDLRTDGRRNPVEEEAEEELDVAYNTAKRARSKILSFFLGMSIAAAGYEAYVHRDELKQKIDGLRGVPEPAPPKKSDISSEPVIRLDSKLYKVTNSNPSSVPGLYICGNNEHGLVSEEKDTKYQAVLKRLGIFDNVLARSVYLGKKSGVLVDENGDLYQWGDGFGGDSTKPSLKGEKIVDAKISNDVIYARNDKGRVLYFPEDVEAQKLFSGSKEGWFGPTKTRYRELAISKPVRDIKCGKEHIVLLTDDGQVYTAATGYGKGIEKSWGQFGMPNLSQFDEAPKPNEVHEVTLLNKYVQNDQVKKRRITQIAAGDYFTMCLDSLGEVWAFGRNTYGAIGLEMDYNTEVISYPSQVRLSSYFKHDEFPHCINIAAGGDTAFATYLASNLYKLFENSVRKDGTFDMSNISDEEQEKLVHVAWGYGLNGELGSGHYVHGQSEPDKIKNVNNIEEFNEQKNRVENIGVKAWAPGEHHVAVTLSNNDVYIWGDNEYGQQGNGKRIRAPAPVPAPSLLEPGRPSKKTVTRTELINNRLELLDNGKFEQVITAGPDTTAIFYRKD
ncbi:DEKNAAC100370 [Brettanomyces naardenensis]|uniref:DEKNAAC100370 n=1 Tax=Brettanomyces naardenensis TaxID=13370 RepID=A0A448YGK3_BRENA|nr:DEKNAAC100370 [Brettanomyces naardenensis]